MSEREIKNTQIGCVPAAIIVLLGVYLYVAVTTWTPAVPMAQGSYNTTLEDKINLFFHDYDMGYIINIKIDERDNSNKSFIVTSSKKGDVLMTYGPDWFLQSASSVNGDVIYYYFNE